jgi:hypothetical protein
VFVVRIPDYYPGNLGSVRFFVILIIRIGREVRARISLIELSIALQVEVVDINTVVVNSDPNTFPGDFETGPDFFDIEKLVSPRVGLVQWVLCDGAGCDTYLVRIVFSGLPEIILIGARQHLVVRSVYVRILTGCVTGAIITSYCVHASEAIGIECSAMIVAIDAILSQTIFVISPVIRIVTNIVIDFRFWT